MDKLPTLTQVMTLGALAAIVAWGVTLVPALAMRGWVARAHRVDPWWWTAGLRALSLVVGALVGWIGGDSDWGAIIGAGGGALCTVIVAVVKARIRKLREAP